MKSFFEWFEASPGLRDRPWTILGKGPSFARRSEFDLQAFGLLTLNHAIREQPAAVAHIIDLDVVDACAGVLARNADVVVMPWIPHVANAPGSADLAQLADQHATLRSLREAGRLVWYNLGTAQRTVADSPVVPVRYFSAEAALALLAQAGVRRVRSLGIDGGASYAAAFDDLRDKTLLANGRRSFDRQFQAIAGIILRTGINFAPLDLESPIRVFVATAEAQMLPTKVLEYSIRKHTSMSVEVTPMHTAGVEIPMPRHERNRPRTPFSFQRFLVPQLASYQGHAIYLDSDMQIFEDLKSLWTRAMHGSELLCASEPEETGRRPQFSVMLLDCERLRWNIAEIVADLDAGRLDYEELMYGMKISPRIDASIDSSWNSLERYSEGETALLHYTDMETQPWVYDRHPFGYLWVRDLFEAVSAGCISLDFVRSQVERGYVRPSLLYQLEHRLEDSVLLPRHARALDRNYRAPYLGLPQHGARPWTRVSQYARALLRHHYQRSGLYRLERRLRTRLADMRLTR